MYGNTFTTFSGGVVISTAWQSSVASFRLLTQPQHPTESAFFVDREQKEEEEKAMQPNALAIRGRIAGRLGLTAAPSRANCCQSRRALVRVGGSAQGAWATPWRTQASSSQRRRLHSCDIARCRMGKVWGARRGWEVRGHRGAVAVARAQAGQVESGTGTRCLASTNTCPVI